MTIRGVPEEVAGKLLRLSRERGISLNAVALEVLSWAVGMDARRERLPRYATWTAEEFAQVMDSVAAQRVIDDSLLR